MNVSGHLVSSELLQPACFTPFLFSAEILFIYYIGEINFVVGKLQDESTWLISLGKQLIMHECN